MCETFNPDYGAEHGHLRRPKGAHRLSRRERPGRQAVREAIDQARIRCVPGLVLAEVDYFLRDEHQRMQFMQDLTRGVFTYAPRMNLVVAYFWRVLT